MPLRPWALALGFLAIALVAYAPSAWSAQFLNFDDNFYFGPEAVAFQAASQRGLFAGLWMLLDPSTRIADVYLPVAHASLFLDSQWGSGAPLLPHLHAAVLHALAALLACSTLRAIGLSSRIAIAAAVAFLVHPALCESVAWVSGRKDVLSGVFVFAALRMCAAHVARPSWKACIGVAAFTALALLSKATAIVVPPLCAIVVLAMRGSRAAWSAPFASLLVALPLAWLHQQNAALAGTLSSGSAIERLSQAPAALLHYFTVAAWPSGLNVLYPEVATMERLRGAVGWAAPTLLLVSIATLLLLRSANWRLLGLSVIAALAALLPFNTAYPGSSIGVADRYLYLALPWIAAAVFGALAKAGRIGLVASGVACIALLACTWSRAAEFGSSERLWRASLAADTDNAVAMLNLLQARASARAVVAPPTAEERHLADRAAAVARYPEHARRAQLQIAQFALQENRFEAAAEAMQRAVAASEAVRDSGRVPRAMGEALLVDTLLLSITPLRLAGKSIEAARALDRAHSLRPEDPRVAAAETLLAVETLATEQQGAAIQPDDARLAAIEQRLAAARAFAPEDAQLDYAAGVLARIRGQALAAIAHFRRAAARQPALAEAWVGAAEVCLERALSSEAEEYARQAIALATQAGRAADPRLRLCLARALQGQGRLDEAIGSLRDYCDQTGQRDREAARLLSGLWMHKARLRMVEHDATQAELQTMIDAALRYNPNEPAVDLVRAHLLRGQRCFAEAVERLERVRIAMPDLEDAHSLLAENLRDLGYERLIQKDDEGAAEAWLRCLKDAPAGFDDEAIQLQLKGIWRRQEQKGIAARKDGEEAKAQAAFRLCLRIDPSQHWAAWLLVAGLVEDPKADRDELDRLSLQALAGQRTHQLDASRQVAVRALVLRRLERANEARELLTSYLAAPDADAGEDVLVVLRKILTELPR